jgi:hypothetical protein
MSDHVELLDLRQPGHAVAVASRTLELAGHIGITTTIEERMPATHVELTDVSRHAFARYRWALAALPTEPWAP